MPSGLLSGSPDGSNVSGSLALQFLFSQLLHSSQHPHPDFSHGVSWRQHSPCRPFFLTITGHGCADPVSTGTHTAVTVHLGLGSIGIRFILQGTLCETRNEGQRFRVRVEQDTLATICAPYHLPDKTCLSLRGTITEQMPLSAQRFSGLNLSMEMMSWGPV